MVASQGAQPRLITGIKMIKRSLISKSVHSSMFCRSISIRKFSSNQIVDPEVRNITQNSLIIDD
jgi:hypothetical protein